MLLGKVPLHGKIYLHQRTWASNLESGSIGEEDEFFRKQIEEFEKAWDEFFEDKPEPESEEESLKQQKEFIQWYNTERKQSDTDMTPEETGTMFAFEQDERS